MARTPSAAVISLTALACAYGCGAGTVHRATAPAEQAAPAATASSPAGSARMIVSFRRVFGTDPMASTLTVYAGGDAVATLGYGGPNGLKVHRFRMPQGPLHRLQGLLEHAQLRTTDASDVHHYIYWVITSAGSYRIRDRLVSRSARPLLTELNAITDAHTGW